MKQILYFLITIITSYFVYRIMNVYWMFAILGLWLVFGFALLKLHFSDALKLWGIVLGFLVIMLGGAVMVARIWSEFVAGVWIVICIVLLVAFQKKLMRLLTVFRIAEQFEDSVKESSQILFLLATFPLIS